VERVQRALDQSNTKELAARSPHHQNVEDAEQFFSDLRKALEGKQEEALSRRLYASYPTEEP